MSKEDPKHGRWILPLVIAGLIGFTFVFVNAIEEATVEGSPSAATSTTSTTSTSTTSSTTTTTLPPEVQAFVDELNAFATAASDLADRATQLNEAWDAGEAGFSATRDGLITLRDDTDALVEDLQAVEVPEAAAEAWDDVIAAAQAMASAADGMIDGLVNAPGPEPRQAALADYTAAAAELQQALAAAAEAATG